MDRPDSGLLAISVACAGPDGAVRVIELQVPPGTTVESAIRRSGVAQSCPGIDPATAAVGIFNRRCEPGQCVQAGDRIEIYQPLRADPKESRRRRAAARRRGGAQ